MEVERFRQELSSEGTSLWMDRRRGERFPLTFDLRFRLLSRRENWTSGRSLNFSHTGVLFKADRPTHLGAAVEMVVDWPSEPVCRLRRELVVAGIVTRVRGTEVALSIRKFAFRSAQPKPYPLAAQQVEVPAEFKDAVRQTPF
jgi:hypothetical protein